MDKQTIVANLRRDLHNVMEMRNQVTHSPLAGARLALREFQSARLAATHADLLAQPQTAAAARFFLDDLYGINDFTRRDADLERVVPMMERVLPAVALKYIAEAIELDCQSEAFDCAMAALLGARFGLEDYARAYLRVKTRAEREAQIGHIESVGRSLCELVHMPLMAASMKAMALPAKLARLSELHHFLEAGFSAFRQMKNPEEFVTTIVQRERTILENLYAGKAQPFCY
jgi:hypothetical protein